MMIQLNCMVGENKKMRFKVKITREYLIETCDKEPYDAIQEAIQDRSLDVYEPDEEIINIRPIGG